MTREERNAANRAAYAAHREAHRRKKREWYAENAEKAREYSRRWRIKNGLHSDRRVPWSRWTEERIAKLRQMRADGITYAECGKELGCTKIACEDACRRYGIPKRVIRKNPEPALPKHSANRRETIAQAVLWEKLLAGARCPESVHKNGTTR